MKKNIIFVPLLALLLFSVSYADPGKSSFYKLNSDSVYLTSAQEIKLGKEYFRQILRQQSLIVDPVIQDYVVSLGDHLTKRIQPKPQFHFFVLDNGEINASTGPAGYIAINTGLILGVSNEEELAAVMAHEIAHVTQHHISRALQRAKEIQLPALATALAAIALGMKNPQLGSGAMAAGMAGIQQNILNFTRSNETEADRVGVHLLYQAGFDPNSMPKLFQRLQSLERFYPVTPEYLRTHPVSPSRIADAENFADQLPKRQYQTNSEFSFIKARTRVVDSNDPFSLLEYYKAKIAKHPKNLADRYGYTLVLLRLHNNKQAMQQINNLISQQPKNRIFLLTQSDIYLADRQPQKSITLLQHGLEENPNYYPLVQSYANALVQAKQNNKAEKIIKDQIRRFPKKSMLYYYLAQAQAANGNYSDAHQSQAKFSFLKGDAKGALRQLQLALRAPHKEKYDDLRIRAKISELEKRA